MKIVTYPLGIIAGIAALIALVLGLWQAGWWFTTQNVQRQYQVNVQSQQYQSGIVSQLRDDASGWQQVRATQPGQAHFLANEFCGQVTDLTIIPADIAADRAAMCN